ncbi:hypothetical protein GE21DRAFT_8477 [Neurospora crassa]|uniref:J domain-containing protein n=2 Tax=Neurospora crassa TaxID=5141 RepID=Q1K5U2_NEUCR|nr:hypothetical protein NCU07204 [Neurospora crassa OR74A]EAA28193.1 hypothetical protein NCU07204 [Neurospora crassa OR74A]KHE85765.1 hypothetical protein GE21DRAFT_8477 [Neurospora crassa]CAD71078.1 related to heat shock protein dnaJ [Neurospora crassa]|eukprot:XP_957429.1 hypothetical protein NCU07204 [Neurospora crassa OR74A]
MNLSKNPVASSLNNTCSPALMPWTLEKALCRRIPPEPIVHSSHPSRSVIVNTEQIRHSRLTMKQGDDPANETRHISTHLTTTIQILPPASPVHQNHQPQTSNISSIYKSQSQPSPLPNMSTTTDSSSSSIVTTPITTSTPLIPLTHYQTLNVPYMASKSDISTAFHAFCKLHRQPGPDKIPHFTSSQRYRDLKEAHDMLIDAEDRQKYDLYLAKKGVPEMVEKFKVREAKKTSVEKKMEKQTDKKMGRGTDKKKMERVINELGEEVLEGWGQDEVIKFLGRPRGPKVRGTNV